MCGFIKACKVKDRLQGMVSALKVGLRGPSIDDYLWEEGFCKNMAQAISERSNQESKEEVPFWDKVSSKNSSLVIGIGLGKASMEERLRQMASVFKQLKASG